MKTTIDLSDALYTATMKYAAKNGMTLREVIEQSLARTLREIPPTRAFKLRDASVGGKGLTDAARAVPRLASRDIRN